MSRPTIIINDLDAERIDRLLEQPAYADLPIADALNAELDRAQMCSPQEMPNDVVTMNSRVKFRNLSDGETRVRTLVYPANMTDSSTQLSVMAPVGALPGGASTHLEVLELEYQPEAAGDFLR
ncbi:nucleoside diphosphate kinase regulator [Salmonella enterica]|nr:nucleoside diphosphate kinase regulator [Salmonella enterica]